jgi:transposase
VVYDIGSNLPEPSISMRGAGIPQESLFTVAKLDDFVPVNHPLRAIRKLANTALQRMSALFDTLYADTGRTSIAPEKLMRAQLLQMLDSLRSERMLMEQLGYNLLFRWFVGLAIDDPVWDHSVFSKNRDRLNAHRGRRVSERSGAPGREAGTDVG